MIDLTVNAGPVPTCGEVVFDKSIASSPACVEPLIDEVITLMTESGWVDSEGEVWLRLILDEVLINALYHGNQGDPSLPVRLQIGETDTHWWMSVADCGTGFAAADVPTLEDEDVLVREHGRGVILMLEWLDHLAYHDGGRIAYMQRQKVVSSR